MIKRRGKTGIWWIDTKIDGKRVRRSLGTQSEAEARKLSAEYVAGVRVETTQGAQRTTLQQAHRRAVREHWQGSKGLRTVERNAQLCIHVLGADTLVRHVDKQAIDRLINHFRSAGNKDSSINRKLSWLGKLLRLCHQWGYITVVPPIPRLKEGRGRLRVITQAEEREVMARAVARGWTEEADLWKCLIDTGCRLSELLKLSIKDVNIADGSITLWDTKNGSFRTVPLTRRASALIRSRFDVGLTSDGRQVFFADQPHYSHMDYTRRHTMLNSIGDKWKVIRQEMGLQDDREFVIHALRHTFASRLVQAGVDLYVVQRLLGHASIKQTEVYAKLHSGNLVDAVRTLEGCDPSCDLEGRFEHKPGSYERGYSNTNSWLQPVAESRGQSSSLSFRTKKQD